MKIAKKLSECCDAYECGWRMVVCFECVQRV